MLIVSNKVSDKKAMKKGWSGLGAAILEQRLKVIYKNQFQLDRIVENNVYTAHLKINLLDYKTQMHTAGWWIARLDLFENALRTNARAGNSQSVQFTWKIIRTNQFDRFWFVHHQYWNARNGWLKVSSNVHWLSFSSSRMVHISG